MKHPSIAMTMLCYACYVEGDSETALGHPPLSLMQKNQFCLVPTYSKSKKDTFQKFSMMGLSSFQKKYAVVAAQTTKGHT
jgi:hypothetical protein